MPTKKSSPKPKGKSKKKDGAVDLDALLAGLPAEARTTAPELPVSVVVLEGDRLLAAGQRLSKQFSALPTFDRAHFDVLRVALPALADAERAWQKLRYKPKEERLGETRKEAEALRASVLAAGRYLLRKDPIAIAELDRIAGGEGLADLVQDLRDLRDFTAPHETVFRSAPKIPADFRDQLEALAERLSKGLDGEAGHLAQERRNGLVALVQHAVDEVRDAARFLLHDDARRLEPFLSRHDAQRKRRQREKKPPKAPDAAPT